MQIALHHKDAVPGTTPLAELEEFLSCSLVQEWNRRYEVEFTYPLNDSHGYGALLEEYQLLDVDGQWFRIQQVDKSTGRDDTVSVLARHVFFDLARAVIEDAEYDETIEELPELEDPEPVSCQEALNTALTRLGMDSTFSASSSIGEEKLMPDLDRKNGVEAIYEIAGLWDGVLLRNNWGITVAAASTPPASATVEYQDNMRSMQETQNSDELVAKIYPVGANDMRLPERYRTTSVPGIPSLPFERHVFFPNARTIQTLRQYADDYLARYGQREAYYSVDCILLQEEAKEKGLATPEDILYVDVGDTVTIRHTEFGVDVDRRVVSVQKDLLQKYNHRLELGRYLHGLPEYLEDFETKTEQTFENIREQNTAMAWAREVMAYVHDVLGGTARNVHPELLLHTSSTGSGASRRKPLSSICTTLTNMTVGGGFPGSPFTQQLYIQDPIADISRQGVTSFQQAFQLIDQYIRRTAGSGGSLVGQINSAYAEHFGEGQVAGYGLPTVGSVFGESWLSGTEEYRYARRILDTVHSQVGNITEVYLEIGGGNGGAIGAINDLYDQIRNPDITPIYWAEVVMEYVRSIVGGNLRDVDPGLLTLTPTKTLRNVIFYMQFALPGESGSEWTQSFSVEDPLAAIKQKRALTIPMAYNYIADFITSTTGEIGETPLTQRLNQRYAAVYGVGQQGLLPGDTVPGVFGEDWEPGTDEYIYAEQVIDLLLERVGNVSGVYLEIGGGSSGLIGSINWLYNKLSGHEMTVSDTDPDDAVGKDGDLWFKFEDEEEEEE